MRQFTRFLFLLMMLILAATHVPADSTGGSKINWLTYIDAQKQKADNNRKFFIYFHADWCSYCHRLDKKTFSNADVADYINANYTPVRIDSDKEKKLAQRFGVQGLPDMRFLDPDGKSIARWSGYIESGPLLNLLRFISTDSYENMNFKDFVKQQK
jgi:thioredoxin-related protein